LIHWFYLRHLLPILDKSERRYILRKIALIFLFILTVNIQYVWATELKPRIILETNHGVIVLELDPQAAPKTVENFLQYVNNKFYDGTIFHRVIKGFMIQGGGFGEDMLRKPTLEPILNEADNGLKNLRGTVAMARTRDPHSATSQFFINTVGNAFLDHKEKNPRGWGYCVFGKVIAGMDVVDAIESIPTKTYGALRDVPVSSVIIQKASVDN
jgi:cyclophilin family peptidyl-prolyl cis-trans isomerase